jgi:hypothetical protein
MVWVEQATPEVVAEVALLRMELQVHPEHLRMQAVAELLVIGVALVHIPEQAEEAELPFKEVIIHPLPVEMVELGYPQVFPELLYIMGVEEGELDIVGLAGQEEMVAEEQVQLELPLEPQEQMGEAVAEVAAVAAIAVKEEMV